MFNRQSSKEKNAADTSFEHSCFQKDNRHDSFKGPFGKFFGGQCGEGFRAGKEQWLQQLATKFGTRNNAANIEENEDAFILSLYAAGLEKSAFHISVNDNVLLIKYTAPEKEATSQYIYQEYVPKSFERAFELNGKVLTDEISATYIDGILTVHLPKDPESNKPAKEVFVG